LRANDNGQGKNIVKRFASVIQDQTVRSDLS
jgi:hypothetical protein